MNPVIYHTGLSLPNTANSTIEIHHTPTIEVDFISHSEAREISEYLKVNPHILVMSKNAVMGLSKWLFSHHLNTDIFKGYHFWTVGRASQNCLQNELAINSQHPSEMTGRGVIQKLKEEKIANVLLIAAQEPSEGFISGLKKAKVNFYHFPVYKTTMVVSKELNKIFKNSSDEFIVFSSSSSVNGFMKTLDIAGLADIKANLVSIGSTTSEAVRKTGGNIFFESPSYDIKLLFLELESLILSRE